MCEFTGCWKEEERTMKKLYRCTPDYKNYTLTVAWLSDPRYLGRVEKQRLLASLFTYSLGAAKNIRYFRNMVFLFSFDLYSLTTKQEHEDVSQDPWSNKCNGVLGKLHYELYRVESELNGPFVPGQEHPSMAPESCLGVKQLWKFQRNWTWWLYRKGKITSNQSLMDPC